MAGAATVEKALDVLFHLHEAPIPLGLSEIGRALDLPKSSCHRLLAALVKREIVEREEGGLYRPGLALLSLGMGAQGREPVVRAARPTLEDLVARFSETVFVVGRRRGRLRVLDRFEGTGFLRAAPDVGDVVPADVTAVGKLYRAFGGDAGDPGTTPSRDDRQASEPVSGMTLESALPPRRQGVGEGDESEAGRIRRDGVAVNRDAWIEGLSVLAVPIWQHGGLGGDRKMAAALALAAASPRFDELGEAAIAEHLQLAAREISSRLGSPEPDVVPSLPSLRGRFRGQRGDAKEKR